MKQIQYLMTKEEFLKAIESNKEYLQRLDTFVKAGGGKRLKELKEEFREYFILQPNEEKFLEKYKTEFENIEVPNEMKDELIYSYKVYLIKEALQEKIEKVEIPLKQIHNRINFFKSLNGYFNANYKNGEFSILIGKDENMKVFSKIKMDSNSANRICITYTTILQYCFGILEEFIFENF